MKARGRQSKAKAKKPARRPAARPRPRATKPAAKPAETVAQLKRALAEALEQQTATSEVLKVISNSPGELEPVFCAMLENATRLCEAQFGMLYRCEGDLFRLEASHNAPPALVCWRDV